MSGAPPVASVSEEDELLAAELAFGLLDLPERAAAERRLSDDGFAAAHRRWQDRAAGLFVDADVAPPAGLWDAIVARLPANDAAAAAGVVAARDGAGRVRRWQMASAAAAVLAIVSTGALLLRPARPVPAPAPRVVPTATPAPRPLIAMLASPERPATMTIGYDPVARRLTTLPSRLAPGRRAAELWVIPAGGVPHSLGVVVADAPGSRVAPAPVAALIAAGATLAISLEPAGGSPTGAPTGPVILTGNVTAG